MISRVSSQKKPHKVHAPTLAQLKHAKSRVGNAVMRAGANGIGLTAKAIVIYLPSADAAAKKKIAAIMHDKAPGIPFTVKVIGVIRPQ
jgi:hypothetical protein